MASKATVVKVTDSVMVVRVDHLDTDSFSRSVDRAAEKARKATRAAWGFNRTSGSYGNGPEDGTRKCWSVVTFAYTRADAAAAVLAYLNEHEGTEKAIQRYEEMLTWPVG
jgi:hypothetical protein